MKLIRIWSSSLTNPKSFFLILFISTKNYTLGHNNAIFSNKIFYLNFMLSDL